MILRMNGVATAIQPSSTTTTTETVTPSPLEEKGREGITRFLKRKLREHSREFMEAVYFVIL